MDDGAEVTAEEAPVTVAAAPARPRRGRLRLVVDLTLLGLVGVLLIGALGVGGVSMYRAFYSPTAFVTDYLSLLSEGRAADALAVPGVSVDSAALEAAGLPTTSSEALLRHTTLAPLADVEVLSEHAHGATTRVTVQYRAGTYVGTTAFDIEQDGWVGLAPTWRFARTPLAALDLTVRGSMRFSVNGFEVDKRQVSPDGVDAEPLEPISMLIFSPGVYRVSVDTAISKTSGVDVLADQPLADIPVDLQADPTPEFVDVVQDRVNEFLDACATQKVLQPTACPFGYFVAERIDGAPRWSIVRTPKITVAPDGADWRIPPAPATAHIEVDIVSLFDGSVSHVSKDVPFTVDGEITVLPDGTASIRVNG